MEPIFVAGMRGLGDNIFQRAFVKTLARQYEVYLSTPWPEIYSDIGNIRFVKSATALRTQAKNIARQAAVRWTVTPTTIRRRIDVSYGHVELRTTGIAASMEKCFGVAPEAWDLPAFTRYPCDKPIAVVRPCTERKEWHNSARGPLPEYIAEIAADLMHTHHVVSVADLLGGAEWLIGEAPPAHVRLHAGELAVRELLGLIQSASVVVGGVGWIVPACIASGIPLFCILGGHGGHNGPGVITDKRMDLKNVGFAMPDQFCRCEQMRHATCDKSISNLAGQWRAWRQSRAI